MAKYEYLRVRFSHIPTGAEMPQLSVRAPDLSRDVTRVERRSEMVPCLNWLGDRGWGMAHAHTFEARSGDTVVDVVTETILMREVRD